MSPKVEFDDFGYQDCEANEVRADEVADLLRDIERHRTALANNAATLQGWLDSNDELRAAWTRFIREGGITADDFDRFMCGQDLHRTPLRQRRHLRLVATGTPLREERRRRE